MHAFLHNNNNYKILQFDLHLLHLFLKPNIKINELHQLKNQLNHLQHPTQVEERNEEEGGDIKYKYDLLQLIECRTNSFATVVSNCALTNGFITK